MSGNPKLPWKVGDQIDQHTDCPKCGADGNYIEDKCLDVEKWNCSKEECDTRWLVSYERRCDGIFIEGTHYELSTEDATFAQVTEVTVDPRCTWCDSWQYVSEEEIKGEKVLLCASCQYLHNTRHQEGENEVWVDCGRGLDRDRGAGAGVELQAQPEEGGGDETHCQKPLD